MERSQDLLDAYVKSLAALSQGTTSYADILSALPQVALIGTAPEEWWVGRETALQHADRDRRMFAEQKLQFLVGEPEVWVEGNVGWVIDQPILRTAEGDEQRLRTTAIWLKENGAWKLLHEHFSIGVPNEEVEPFASLQQAHEQPPL